MGGITIHRKKPLFQEENQYMLRLLYMRLYHMRENLVGNKFLLTLRALHTNVTVHVPILGVIGHQPWLNQFVAHRTLQLLVQA